MSSSFVFSNLNDLALLAALHLSSMLTPGLNTSAVITNTVAGGVAAGYRTAGALAVGAFALSSLSVLAFSSVLMEPATRRVMAVVSIAILCFFCWKIARKLLRPTAPGIGTETIGPPQLFVLYIANPQSIIFFSVLIFSTGLQFNGAVALSVLAILTLNTFLYYGLIARLCGALSSVLMSPRMQTLTNAVLFTFLALTLVKVAGDLLTGTI